MMKIARVLFISSALLLSQAAAHGQELRRILYGTSTSVSHLPIWVAKDAGLFARHGLNVEPVQIRGGALSTMAIMSGQVVLSGVGAESGSRPASRALMSFCWLVRRSRTCLLDDSSGNYVPADLRGAGGVTRLGSSSIYLRTALRMVGIDSTRR
jgi:ABC-type nitrate/sulfonate/bicarbonate transport system substrate-binding protein